MASQPLLKVDDLTLTYMTPGGSIAALDRVNFSVQRGGALALVGESGSGKSTAALAVLGLLGGEGVVTGGRMSFDGADLASMTHAQRAALRGHRISAVFQDPFTSLNPALTVGFQTAEPLMHLEAMSQSAAMRRVIELFEEVGIPRAADVADSYPHQLSGGMQQRVLIAAALACDPELLLLDEPTTALDVTIEAQVLDLLTRLRRERNLSILFITHNLGIVSQLCDDLCVLYAGAVVESGPASEILRRPRHPYTKGLLASIPPLAAGHGGHALPSISGRMPDPLERPKGCVFHPRCPFAEDACRSEDQAMREGGDGVTARCRRVDAVADQPWPLPEGRATTVNGAPARGAAAGHGGSSLSAIDLKTHYVDSGFLKRVRLGWRGVGLDKPRRVRAVDGVTLQARRGETIGLVGESGCGKSTLGRSLLRLTPSTDGRVELDGTDVTSLSERGLKDFRRRVQVVFQNPDSSLNPRKSIHEILDRMLVLFEDMNWAQRDDRITELLEQVGLSAGYARRYPHQLSGGEKQRVGIARALAVEPDFIICDEAVSALDVSVQATVLNLLADLRDRLGIGYVFISHDLSVVAHLSDRIAVMYAGVIAEEGPADAVLTPPYHPYTEALLAAVPHIGERREDDQPRLRTGGHVAAPTGVGCPFQDRCPRKLGAICETDAPPILEPAPGHWIRCHIPLETLRAQPSLAADPPAAASPKTARA